MAVDARRDGTEARSAQIPTAKPPILAKFFYEKAALLSGPIVDDAPLSETVSDPRILADQKNYIQWLADNVARADPPTQTTAARPSPRRCST